MLRLVLLALFVLVDSEDFLGVNYTFDVDFYTNFDSEKCDNLKMWRLVTYESMGMEPPFNSDKAIRAGEESCATSFPIIFFGGTLEINFYSQDVSHMWDLKIEVLDEDGRYVTNYVHRRSRRDFEAGWQTVSLKVNKHVKGHIRLRGRSLNGILLIDSFIYTPNNTITYNKRFRRSSSDKDEEELIFENVGFNKYETETVESSGDDENGTEQPTTDKPDIKPEGRDTIWNPFTISLVSFGVVVAVALCVVGAYHLGKIRTVNQVPLPFDVEPPRTITIPRVTGRSNLSRSSTVFNYSN